MLLLVVGLVVIVLVILVVVFLSVRSMRADEDPRDRDLAPRRRTAPPAARPAVAEQPRRVSALPRPRGHQHDQDFEASDWDGVSDEQYWAELSADKPLATTARSAQPGSDPRPPAPVRSGADPAAADATGRRAGRDAAAGRSRREHAPPVGAAAAAPTAQFTLRSRSEPPASEPAMPADPWTDPLSAVRGSDTDPSMGAEAGWRDTAGDGPATTAWTAADPEAPAAGDAGTAGDTRTWGAEDPLTSPSFSAASTYSTDSRSYRSSHDRALARSDELGVIPGRALYGGGDDYGTARSWDSPGPKAAAPSFGDSSFGDSYGSGADGWPGSDHAHPSGPLEPLPALSGSSEPAASWYSAPTPAAGTQPFSEPSYQPWDQAPEPLTGSGYGERSGYTEYPEASRFAGTPREHGYGDDTGYGDVGYGDDTGYGEAGYGQPAHDWRDADYQLPDYRSAPGGSAGYEQPGHERDDAGYQLPGYGSGDSSYFDQDPGYGNYPGHDGGRR
jgi:hypothetical protein